jgi:3-hydroxyisobutyrate dehydrogenase-like beta-hydroxyacid dehydrogenase
MNVAFIGLGNMGGHISRNLAKAGIALTVFLRGGEPSKRELHGADAEAGTDLPAASARGSQYPVHQLVDVVLGELLRTAGAGTTAMS